MTDHIGLILKCSEIREKMRHCGGGTVQLSHLVRRDVGQTHLQILHQVVKHAQAFGILAILDVD